MNRDIAGVYLLKSRPTGDGMRQDPTESKPVKSYSQQLANFAKSNAYIIDQNKAPDYTTFDEQKGDAASPND